jgi:molybdopterin-containing oxidoreductase family membrane subunit
MTAGLFPIIHLGRPWYALWLMPYPNERALWPNFRSPLLWDVFAVSTYFTISATFFFVGLIPDIAAARDRATTKFRKVLYGVTSLGWRGNHIQWKHYSAAYLIFAAFATPLVVSVHSVVSWDFAMSIVPGWHATIFPPYFVAGAIFSGFAMVQTLLLILRKVMNFENYITMFHIESMNIIIMTTGSIVGVAYLTELFIAMYSRSEYEMYAFENRMLGPYAWAYWSMMTCNVISPQLFWFKKIRTSIPISWILSIVVNIGMWFERFVIIVTSLHRDYLPSSWAMFYPTWTDVGIFVGSIGLFFTLFLLFLRFLPGIAIAEVKLLLKSSSLQHKTKLAQEGAFPEEQVKYFQESLEKYDSVTEEEIKELSVRK